MNEALRPMPLGEILDRTIQIYRSRMLLFAAIGALSAISSLAVAVASRFVWPIATYLSHGLGVSRTTAGYLVSWIDGHFTLALHSVLYPVYISCASGMVFGSDVSARRGFGVLRKRWRTYAWLGTLKVLLQMIIPEALAVGLLALVGVAADHMSGDNPLLDPMMWTFVGILGVFALYVVFWFWPSLAFSFQACVAETLPARASLRRSFRLARGRRGSVVLVWATIWIANSIAWFVLQYILWWAMYLLLHGRMYGNLSQRVFAVALYGAWGVGVALLAPIYPIAVTLFYYDQRIRKEGFDVEWMMQSAGMMEDAGTPAAGAESAAPEAASVPVEEAGA
jgi:hypothetical protein